MNYTDLFIDKTKNGKKIPTNEYHSTGKHPIVDQGKACYAGYTDLEDGLFTDIPALVFGDHTRVIKLVEEPFFLGADGTKIIKAIDENANYNYLYYLLKSINIPNTGYNRHYKWLKTSEFEVHSPRMQSVISDNLILTEQLISRYKKELTLLDSLVKSRFVELFSDVYEEQSLGDVCAKITDGEHGTVERYTSGRLYLMARNISMDNDLDLSEVSYISEKDHQRIFKRCNPEQGDLLLVCVGATIGKVSIVPEMEEFSMARSVALIKPKRELLDSHYLLAALQSEQVKKQIKNSIHSSAQGGLYTSSIKRIRIPLPPIEIQKRFSEEINKIGKSKSVIQKSLDEAQLLFDSLMQEYFG